MIHTSHGHDRRSRVDAASTHRRGRRWLRAAAICSGVVFLGVLAAGCGGGPGPGIASLGSTATSTPNTAFTPKGDSGSEATQLRYVQCLHTQGFPNFPEPGPYTPAVKQAMSGIDLNSPKFQRAMHSCEKLLPRSMTSPPPVSPQLQGEALKFTNCMRAHGEKSWPDPLPGGGYVPYATGAAANSPLYKEAAKACDPLLPGA